MEWVSTRFEKEQLPAYEEPAAQPGYDQRSEERKPFHAQITVASETNFFMGFAENISEGGVFLSTYNPPPVGERISITISLNEESELVEVEGIVRWHRTDEDELETGCGVQFVDLTPLTRRKLDEMVRRASQEPLLFEV